MAAPVTRNDGVLNTGPASPVALCVCISPGPLSEFAELGEGGDILSCFKEYLNLL